MFLTITLYEHEGADRFAVKLVDPDNLDNDPVDVTNQYELSACQDEHGRSGFTVIRTLDEPRDAEGKEL